MSNAARMHPETSHERTIWAYDCGYGLESGAIAQQPFKERFLDDFLHHWLGPWFVWCDGVVVSAISFALHLVAAEGAQAGNVALAIVLGYCESARGCCTMLVAVLQNLLPFFFGESRQVAGGSLLFFN